MTGRHAKLRLPLIEWAAIITVAIVFLCLGLSVLAAMRENETPLTRWRTVTVPGPTVTQSYLILRTVTPGVGGF